MGCGCGCKGAGDCGPKARRNPDLRTGVGLFFLVGVLSIAALGVRRVVEG